MHLRVDKCVSFGMKKQGGNYDQFKQSLFIDNVLIPPVESDGSFKYLGKIFDFSMNNNITKLNLVTKLSSLLNTLSRQRCSVYTKLKILKLYIPSQFSFDLRINDLSSTWIEQNLDSLICNSVREWLNMPVSSCVAEVLHLPLKQGGLGISSLKDLNQTLQLKVRSYLKSNSNTSMRELWQLTSAKHIESDSRLVNPSLASAVKVLKESQAEAKLNHIESLKLQGNIFSSLIENLPSCEVSRWSHSLAVLPDHLFKFCRKALVQQLPSNSNLKRWGISASEICGLCNAVQTNKHVLSNCGSSVALERYKSRHNSVLSLVSEWLVSSLVKDTLTLCVDLDDLRFKPIDTVFVSLRPDIVLFDRHNIYVLELTICHESNLASAQARKATKYADLGSNLKHAYSNLRLAKFYFQVSTLGLISDLSNFCSCCNIPPPPRDLKNKISSLTLSKSYEIYCNRNTPI
jgi:hypothetical protein